MIYEHEVYDFPYLTSILLYNQVYCVTTIHSNPSFSRVSSMSPSILLILEPIPEYSKNPSTRLEPIPEYSKNSSTRLILILEYSNFSSIIQRKNRISTGKIVFFTFKIFLMII